MKNKVASPDTKLYNSLILSCFLLYLFYIGIKNIYSAEIVEIMKDFQVSKSQASIATTATFISYSIMQVIFVRFSKKINIIKFLYWTVPIALVSYIACVFCTDIRAVWVFFAISGGLTGGIYPSILTAVGQYLPDSMLPRANFVLSFAFSFGTVITYLLASLFIKLGNWRLGFWAFAFLTLAATLYFCRNVRKCRKSTFYLEKAASQKDTPVANEGKNGRSRYLLFLLLTGAIILLSTMLYYGILGWVTSLLHDEFHLSSSLSVLVSVLIPIAIYIGPWLQICMVRRMSIWKTGLVFSMISCITAVLLALFFRIHVVFALLATTCFLIFVRGINNLGALEIPLRYHDVYDTGKLGTILNIYACIGAAIGPPICGSIIDTYGHVVNYSFNAAVLVIVFILFLLGDTLLVKKKNIAARHLPKKSA